MHICVYIYIHAYKCMGIVWLIAFCSVWALVIEFLEVVHVSQKMSSNSWNLCTFHRICAHFTDGVHLSRGPPNNVRVRPRWIGRLSLGALNQTIPKCIYIYIFMIWYRLDCLDLEGWYYLSLNHVCAIIKRRTIWWRLMVLTRMWLFIYFCLVSPVFHALWGNS